MAKRSGYPNTFLAAVGSIATTWAFVEQEILLQTSALASKATDGWPIENLRVDFKRLRERWYELAKAEVDTKTLNKIIHPINTELARLSPIRGYVIHGTWQVTGRGKYRVSWWEQKKELQRHHADFTLADLRGFAAALLELYAKAERCLR
jgi:hypothetical protein